MKQTVVTVLAVIVLFAASSFAGDMGKVTTIEGWVSDTACAAQGVKNCNNKQHLEQGAKLALVADADGKIWVVGNPEKLVSHMGHHVKVKGETNADAGTISVQQVSMMKKMKDKDMDMNMKDMNKEMK